MANQDAKNAQQGIVPESKPEVTGDGSEHFENKSDESGKANFPVAQRYEYELPPDAQRIQAERRKNLGELQERDQQVKSTIAGEPTPSGESDNPHEDEEQGDVPKHSDDEPVATDDRGVIEQNNATRLTGEGGESGTSASSKRDNDEE